jgi:hypothetical protein
VGLHRRRRLVRCGGVAVALILTALVDAWWLLPPAVAIVLAASLRRATES